MLLALNLTLAMQHLLVFHHNVQRLGFMSENVVFSHLFQRVGFMNKIVFVDGIKLTCVVLALAMQCFFVFFHHKLQRVRFIKKNGIFSSISEKRNASNMRY